MHLAASVFGTIDITFKRVSQRVPKIMAETSRVNSFTCSFGNRNPIYIPRPIGYSYSDQPSPAELRSFTYRACPKKRNATKIPVKAPPTCAR
jgi:hypothetical protein